jgi:hypothetical protein
MTAVADTLGVVRSNLVARAKRGGSRLQYRKAGDAELLARIRPLVDARPSYGYRRITALLNRQAEAEGLAWVNHKRVYRVMKRAGLLLAPHTLFAKAVLIGAKQLTEVIRAEAAGTSDAQPQELSAGRECRSVERTISPERRVKKLLKSGLLSVDREQIR